MTEEDTRTIWCGNLPEKITEDILYELFLQGGPLQKVNIPKDRDGKPKTFGFVTYKHQCSVPYALELFDGTVLFNRTLNLKSRNNILTRSENPYHHETMVSSSFQQNRQFCYQPELGQQILLGNQSTHALYAQSNMFNMIPNSYPSQNSNYSKNPQQSDYSKNTNRHRSHLYGDRDNYNSRHNNRVEPYKRDHKSHKSSSYRSDRHDNRRKYR